jgi:Phage tail tube protein
MAFKQDSNLTGLRYAVEATLGNLPDPESNSVWYALEPNSYSDFGGQLATVARNPINPTRQRKKGAIVDLDASGGFNQDLTANNLTRLMQGFFFATARQKPTSATLNAAAVAMTAIAAAADDYTAAAGLPTTILSGNLVFASGFGVAANNGLKVANATSTATAISVSDSLSDEASPPAAAKVDCVGWQFGSGTSAITLNGSLVRLTDSAKDMTTLGLVVGEWIYVGGDASGVSFPTAGNTGFARISAIATGYLEFDKVSWTPTAEVGTAKTIQIFFGTLIRNEPARADIVRRTYQLERTLGEDDDGEMSEYIVGAVANELTINYPQADKINIDLSFVGIDNEQRTGAVGVKAGDRPTLVAEEAINTSNDFARIQLGVVSTSDATITPLFAYAQEMTLTINNNVSPNKALGVLGAFDVTAGTFEVGGSITAYFADVAAVQAVRNNSDVTLDIIIAKDNTGFVFDVPLMGLGDGRLNVEQDQPITLPLENNAAESATLGYTLAMIQFPYLPTIAG